MSSVERSVRRYESGKASLQSEFEVEQGLVSDVSVLWRWLIIDEVTYQRYPHS